MSDAVNFPVPEGDPAAADGSASGLPSSGQAENSAGADEQATALPSSLHSSGQAGQAGQPAVAGNADSNSLAGTSNGDARARAHHGSEQAAQGEDPRKERRSRRRALISAPVRVRSSEFTEGAEGEISTTLDVSRGGFLYISSLPQIRVGTVVQVTFPYSKSPAAIQAEQSGRVVRVTEMADGRRAVAIAVGRVSKEEFARADMMDNSGKRIEEAPQVEAIPAPSAVSPKRLDQPVVLIVDSDEELRDALKIYLIEAGYEPIAVPNAAEAHAVLSLYTPAMVVAEIEGEDLPGYDLCARIKTTPRLQTIPVVLMTRSAYPSDYANAHSLGAVVCMAKPFRLERFGHVVKLLAPKLHSDPEPEPESAPPPAHPRRKHTGDGSSKHRSSGKGHKGHGPRPRR